MRVVVINLDRATTRMAFQDWQLRRLGLECERLAAIDAASPDDRPEAYWDGWQRPIAPSERACLRSHMAAWELVAGRGEPMLILEDDALLSQDVPAILEAARGLAGVDLLQLETRARAEFLSRRGRPLGPVAMHRLYLDRAGAAGYVLWPSGARRLLARAARRPALADALIATPGLLRCHQAVPAGVIQNDMHARYGVPSQWPDNSSSVSTAAHRRARKSSGQVIRRLMAQLRLGLAGLAGRLLHRKAEVPFDPARFVSRP